MPKADAGARRTKPDGRGKSAASKAAGRANLAKGREARKKSLANKGPGGLRPKDKWALLEDGGMTIHDLDDEEIRRMQLRSKDGSFAGSVRPLSPKWARAFGNEAKRRALANLTAHGIRAVEVLLDMLENDEIPASVRAGIGKDITDRTLGKAPLTVNIEGDDLFAALLVASVGADRSGVGVDDDMADAAGEEG